MFIIYSQKTVCFFVNIGYYNNFTPKFVKKYADIGAELLKGFNQYCNDVRNGSFPEDSIHTYKISDEEAAKLEEVLKKL